MISLEPKKKKEIKREMHIKMIIITFLKKHVFQYQMAKFNSAKLQLLLHQPNTRPHCAVHFEVAKMVNFMLSVFCHMTKYFF